jgi:hypothetical protein
MSDTNKILLTVDDIFRMQGRQRGFDPTDLEYEQANKTADDMNRDLLKARMAPPPAAVTGAPSPAPQQLREGSVVRQNGVTYRITNGVPVPVTGP